MSYKNLYDFCQALPIHINRNTVRDKALELTGIQRVRTFKADLDTKVTRGQYLSPRNTNHQFVIQAGGHVIVVARTLNRCWERFVYVKELMHLFDDLNQATDTGEAFEKLLRDFSGLSATDWSDQMRAEVNCFWRALAILCPEKFRLEFQAEREGGRLDDYAIALRLRIPELYVPQLFRADFLEIVGRLTRTPAAVANLNAARQRRP